MRNSRIAAAVNLDGSLDYAPDHEMATPLAPGFDPANLRIPYLMLVSQRESEIKTPPMRPSFPV